MTAGVSRSIVRQIVKTGLRYAVLSFAHALLAKEQHNCVGVEGGWGEGGRAMHTHSWPKSIAPVRPV